MPEKIAPVKVGESDKPVIDRANYWWKLAVDRKHPFDKFISGWISFNILYNFITRKNNKTGSEAKRVELTVQDLFNESSWSGDLENSIRALMEYDVGADIWYRESYTNNWFSTHAIRESIQQALKENKNKEALVKTYEIIYHVRCNLFHGDKSDDNTRDLNVVNLCWEVMRYSYPPMLKTQS